MVADSESDTHYTHNIYTFSLEFRLIEAPLYLYYFYSDLSTYKSFLLVYNNRVMFYIYLLLLSSLYILMSRWRLEQQQQAFAETARPYYFLYTIYNDNNIVHDNRQLVSCLYFSIIILFYRRQTTSQQWAKCQTVFPSDWFLLFARSGYLLPYLLLCITYFTLSTESIDWFIYNRQPRYLFSLLCRRGSHR